MNGHTEPDSLWQQPVANIWIKSTRGGRAWSDTTTYPSVFQALSAPERTFVPSKRPPEISFASSLLSPSLPKTIRTTTWQQVPQDDHPGTFPACHRLGIAWGSSSPWVMRKCGYLLLSHLFHATRDFTVFCPVLFTALFSPALRRSDLCGSHSISPSIAAACSCCTVKRGREHQKCSEFRRGGTEVFEMGMSPLTQGFFFQSGLETWQSQPGTG